MSGTSFPTQNLLLLKQMVIMQLVIHNGFIIVYLESKIISFSSNKMLSYICKYFPSLCTDNVYMSLELIQKVVNNKALTKKDGDVHHF